MRAHLLSLIYRLRAEQFMLAGPTKTSALGAVAAAHQRLTTVLSDCCFAMVESAVVAAAHRQLPFRADLLRLTRLLRADRLPGS